MKNLNLTPIFAILLVAIGILLIVKVDEFIIGQPISYPYGLLIPFVALVGYGYLLELPNWLCDKI